MPDNTAPTGDYIQHQTDKLDMAAAMACYGWKRLSVKPDVNPNGKVFGIFVFAVPENVDAVQFEWDYANGKLLVCPLTYSKLKKDLKREVDVLCGLRR